LGVLGDFEASDTSNREALALSHEIQDRYIEASSLHGLGYNATIRGELPEAISYMEESLVITREMGNNLAMILILNHLGWALFRQGNYEQAWAVCEEAVALSYDIDAWQARRGVQTTMSLIAQHRGDYALAKTLLEANLAAEREKGSRSNIASDLNNLGYLMLFQHDSSNFSYAQELLEESLKLFQEIGNRTSSVHPTINLVHLALLRGDYSRAEELLRKALEISSELSARRPIAECLEFLAAAAVGNGHTERAAVLFGSAENLREVIGDPLRSHERVEYEQDVSRLREAMDPDGLTDAWARGRSMSMEEAVAYALED